MVRVMWLAGLMMTLVFHLLGCQQPDETQSSPTPSATTPDATEQPDCLEEEWQQWTHPQNNLVGVSYPISAQQQEAPELTLNPMCWDPTLPEVIHSFSKNVSDEWGNDYYGYYFWVGYEWETELPLWLWLQETELCPESLPEDGTTLGEFLVEGGYDLVYWDDVTYITAHIWYPIAQESRDYIFWKAPTTNQLYIATGWLDLHGFDIEIYQTWLQEYDEIMFSFPQ